MHTHTTTSFRALSSVEGRINKVLVSFPAEVENYRQIRAHFHGLFHAMRNSDVEFIVVTNADACRYGARRSNDENFVRSNLEKVAEEVQASPRIRVVPIFLENRPHLQLGIWVQDFFCVLHNPTDGATALLESVSIEPEPPNILDTHVADVVAAECGYLLKPVRQRIVGGDILIGDDFALVGNSIFRGGFGGHNRYGIDRWADAEEFLQRSLGVSNIVWAQFDRPDVYRNGTNNGLNGHNGAAPLTAGAPCHVDRIITVGGTSPDADNACTLFVAEIRDEYCIGTSLHPNGRVSAFAQVLDRTAERLRNFNRNGLHFDVVRLPMLVEKPTLLSPYFYSFNNCLVESYGQQHNAYIPHYRPATGAESVRVAERVFAEVERTFNSRGFNVSFVEGEFPSGLAKSGSLHCATKVLERGN